MTTFNNRIQSIAQRKVLSRAFNGKTPNLTYNSLSHEEQKALALALIEEDEAVREFIASRITNDIEDAYCDMVRPSEAIEDAIELARLRADIGQRSRDMQQAMQGG